MKKNSSKKFFNKKVTQDLKIIRTSSKVFINFLNLCNKETSNNMRLHNPLRKTR